MEIAKQWSPDLINLNQVVDSSLPQLVYQHHFIKMLCPYLSILRITINFIINNFDNCDLCQKGPRV